MNDVDFIVDELKALSDPVFAAKLSRYGIEASTALGIRVPLIRNLAKTIGIKQDLSLALWKQNIHEAKLLAVFIGNVKQVTNQQIDYWVSEFDSWDICDQACAHLFVHTPFWREKVFTFVDDEREFVKRAGFVLIAAAAVHRKKESDTAFLDFFPLIEQQASDPRNFVKKAVSWALRQLGKRNAFLHQHALETAKRILASHSKSNWVALDALRELKAKGPGAV